MINETREADSTHATSNHGVVKVCAKFWPAADVMKLSRQMVVLASFLSVTALYAHNLDTRATSIHYAADFINLMSQRAATNAVPIQVGDEFWVVIKTTPGPGTTTGVGGYQTFYVPPWAQILDAGYVLPNPTVPSGFEKIPMKGQSPIAIGAPVFCLR